MQITIYRKGHRNRWEAVATANAWSIADAIGCMLSKSGDEASAMCGSLTIYYENGDIQKDAA